MKKYVVSYMSGSTGYGWTREYNRIIEFEHLVRELGREYTVAIKVWDNDIRDFIYWKDCLTYKCDVDILHSYDRDLRTRDRKCKKVV